MDKASRRFASALPALVFVAGLIAVHAWVLPAGGLWTGDQGAKLVQVESLIRQGFADPALIYPGAALDPRGRFSPLPGLYAVARDGEWISVYSYPYAALCASLYGVSRAWGLYLPSMAAALGCLLLSVPLARSLELRSSRALPWVVGLATPWLFYALSFWEHALAALFAAVALGLASTALAGDARRPALAAGILAGAAFLIRPEAVHFGPALAAGLALATRRGRLAAAALAGWILGLLPAAALHAILYGHPLGGGVKLNFGARALESTSGLVDRLLASRGQIAGHLAFDREPSWGLFALLLALACALPLVSGWRRAAVCLALAVTALELRPAGGRVLETGLVASCPLVLLALAPGGGAAAPANLLRGFCGAYFLAVVMTAPNDGGAQWGPRYLLPLALPLSVLATHQAERLVLARPRLERAAGAVLVAVLLVLSVALQLHGVRVLRDSLERQERLEGAVAGLGHEVVVTDVWWAPQILARQYFERQLFLVERPRKLAAFLRRFEAEGGRSFGFVATRDWSRDDGARRRAGAECRLASRQPRLDVLDCRLAAGPGD